MLKNETFEVREDTFRKKIYFEMSTYTKEILKAGDASKTIKAGDTVTVRADLYLKAGKAIWSTHEPSGFLFAGTFSSFDVV